MIYNTQKVNPQIVSPNSSHELYRYAGTCARFTQKNYIADIFIVSNTS